MKNLILAIALMAITSTAHAGKIRDFFFGKKEPTNETVVTNVVDGDTRTVVLTGEEYVKTRSIESSEEARGKCFDANAAMPTDGTAQALREMRLATGGAIDCGNGYADTLIAVENRKLGQTQARWGAAEGLGKALIGGGTKAYLGGKALDVAEEIFTTQAENAGTQVEINPSDESSVVIDGNVGEGNTINNEAFSGIATEPAKVNPIDLQTPEAGEIPVVCVDLRPLAETDPEGTDANGDGVVCSDGAGGVTDN